MTIDERPFPTNFHMVPGSHQWREQPVFRSRPADPVIEAMCLAELGPWITRRLDYRAALSEYMYYNLTNATMFLLHIRDGRVSIMDKPQFCTREQLDADSSPVPWLNATIAYRKFIQEVVVRKGISIETILALELNDAGLYSETAPIFKISKLQGSHAVLLPHFEFIFQKFHEAENDTIDYYDKSVSAIFIGSTTGAGLVTAQSVRDQTFQRLRSAMFFKDNPRVGFRLPHLVSCTPEAERLLRQMGFGGGWEKFSDHYKHRFIISMDGNAGTCSRLTLGLKSNSVVLKYASNYVMHYSGQLVPWLHYVPIAADGDIEAVLDWETREPGRFEYIARQGTQFFNDYLHREQVVSYTEGLIRAYAKAFDPALPLNC